MDAYIATNLCGNSTFLKYVFPEHDINEVKTYIDDCYKSFKSTISKDAEKWAEFTAAGGSAEFGVDFDLLIQEGHEYYSYYMHRFENDEDTYFLDKNAVEAFATVSVGIEWVVPRKMESEWGESRDQQYDAVLVRIDGSWYTVGL